MNASLRPRRRCAIPSPRIVLAATLLAVALAGCQNTPPPPDVISADAERGPLKVHAVAQPAHPRVGDTVRVTLSATTPPDHLVLFPDASAFGDLPVTVAPLTAPAPLPEGKRWQQDYFVDPLVGGDLALPDLVVHIAAAPADGAAPDYKHELRISGLKLTVASALTTTDTIEKPRAITGTLAPPPRPMTPLDWAILAGSCMLAIGLAWFVARWIRSRLFAPPPPLPPDIAALRALADLAARDLFAAGRVREYYYRLSEIVRLYIERKFTLAAPEMTTEEFLRTLTRNTRALPYDAGKLRDFLESCDIVKYAAFAPQRNDADDALASARAFIHTTAAATQGQSATNAAPASAGGAA